jgi:Na+/proline symporter/signal transduction histidine kinase
MVPFNILVAVCLGYVLFLFLVAFAAERRAAAGPAGWLRSPLIYTLSLSIYCTAWTFYGAVGYAARSGLEFLTIYLGPTLVLVGWWLLLRKLVRIGQVQRVTSIADLIASRFGKSNTIGVIVTMIAVVAATPYIALQLQSVTLSFEVFAAAPEGDWTVPETSATALWVAGGLAIFTVLFGTRNLDANERHHGVVMAIAVEAVVKLVALLAVGIFVVWGVAGGLSETLARIDASPIADWTLQPGRWAGLIAASAAAVVTLPRMFQVMVVENSDERHLATASWAFPLYLFAMSLFVVPIAALGLARMPAGSNPDLFVLTLPLAEGKGTLAMLAFLGGFSSATSMVIVEAIALATMVSNHVVTPLWLSLRSRTSGAAGADGMARAAQRRAVPGDVRGLVLMSRRLSIAGILALGYLYFRMSGGSASLAAIGLIAFVGVAQVLPAMLGGLFWRGATHAGAAAGLLVGFAVWCWTLFLPSFGASGLLSPQVLAEGPFGIGWLRPEALFGVVGLDPVMQALFWSITLNAGAFVLVSLLTFPSPLERMQGLAFVHVFDQTPGAQAWSRGGAEPEDLLAMTQGILGSDEALTFFREAARSQGKAGYLPDATPAFIEALERRLAGAVGSATAHAMIGQIAVGAAVTVQDLLAVASEAQQIMEYSARLEEQSEELARTARQLAEANDKLTRLSVQKDAFLGQISHELRTPMTAIRAFSEILMQDPDASDDSRRQAEIVHQEAIRLTRLLDDLLDLSVLEGGRAQVKMQVASLHDLITRAIRASAYTRPDRDLVFERDVSREDITVATDTDRLVQVFINLISNARKYCNAEVPVLRIEVRTRAGQIEIDFVDNGAGIPKASQDSIFEKFARLDPTSRTGGAGLGLAICREIMANLGGTIAYLPGQGGAAFRVTLPMQRSVRRAA